MKFLVLQGLATAVFGDGGVVRLQQITGPDLLAQCQRMIYEPAI